MSAGAPVLTGLLVLLAALALAGCGAANPAEGTVRADVLVEPAPGEGVWHRGVELTGGASAYDLLAAAVGEGLEAEWYAEYKAHFITAIGAVAPEGNAFWAVFTWNAGTQRWEPLPVGADAHVVSDGEVMGWAVVTYDPETPQLPQTRP
ncbi:MAG: hypothetical protein VW450_04755 [Chloroflexota bacterium]